MKGERNLKWKCENSVFKTKLSFEWRMSGQNKLKFGWNVSKKKAKKKKGERLLAKTETRREIQVDLLLKDTWQLRPWKGFSKLESLNLILRQKTRQEYFFHFKLDLWDGETAIFVWETSICRHDHSAKEVFSVISFLRNSSLKTRKKNF